MDWLLVVMVRVGWLEGYDGAGAWRAVLRRRRGWCCNCWLVNVDGWLLRDLFFRH